MKPNDISKKLKVGLRTIQRWVKDVPPQVIPIPSAIKLHEVEEVEEVETKPRYEPPQENYLESVGALVSGSLTASKHWWRLNGEIAIDDCNAHTDIVIKLEKLLHDELDAQEPNTKRIALLSLCLVRHCDARTKALNFGRGDMISLAQAYARVQSAGSYVVLPEKLVSELLGRLYPDVRAARETAQQAEEAGTPIAFIPSPTQQSE